LLRLLSDEDDCVIFEIVGHLRKNKGFAGKVLLFKYVLNELIDGLCRISDGRSVHSREKKAVIRWFGSELFECYWR